MAEKSASLLNKLKRFRRLAVFGIFSTICVACSNRREYDFTVVNDTRFDMSVVKFDWCNGSNEISVGKHSTHPKIRLTYRVSAMNFFGSGELCVAVFQYSDSVSTFFNNRGISIPRDMLSRKKMNTITISENIPPSERVFSIELSN